MHLSLKPFKGMLVEQDDEAYDFDRGERLAILKKECLSLKKNINQKEFPIESSQVDHSKPKQEQLRVEQYSKLQYRQVI